MEKEKFNTNDGFSQEYIQAMQLEDTPSPYDWEMPDPFQEEEKEM